MTVLHRAEAYQSAESILRDEGRPADREQAMHAVVEALWAHLAACDVSWLGFYVDQPDEPDDRRLVLGPHRDKPACSPIGLHGACGRALTEQRSIIIDDVRELGEDYIACDPRDLSELVVPLAEPGGSCWGLLDLDSFSVGAFSPDDVAGLSRVLRAAGLTPIE